MAESEPVQGSSLDGNEDGYFQLIQQALDPTAPDPAAIHTADDGVVAETPNPSVGQESVSAFDQDDFIDDAVSQLRSTLKGQFQQFRHEVHRACDEKLAIRTEQQQSEMRLAAVKMQQLRELAAKLQLCYDRAECRDQHRLRVLGVLAGRWHAVRAVSHSLHHWLSASRKRCRLRFLEARYSIPTEQRSLRRRSLNRWRSALVRIQKAKREELFKSQLDLVSRKLVCTYEANLQAIRAELAEAKRQIAFLTQNKERMEREMKQAFLRSVSALNLEAMSMFNSKLGEPDETPAAGGEQLEPRTRIPQPSPSDNTRDLP